MKNTKNKNIFSKFINKYRNMPLPVRASFWFVVCSVLQKGISFFTTPIFTRLLSTEQYGQVTLYSSWAAIVCIFTTLNLQYGSFNTAQVKFQDDRDRYSSSLQGVVTLLTATAFVLYFINPSFWSTAFELPAYIVAFLLIDLWAQFATGLWMGKKRFDYKYKPMVALTLFTSLVIPLLGIIIIPNVVERGEVRILTIAGVNIAIGTAFFIYNLIKGKTLFDKTYWKFALGFNIPLIPYYLSQTVFNMSDRIMIAKMVGTDKAGIYGLAYTVATILTFVMTAIGDAYTPWYYRRIKANDSNGVKSINKSLMIFVAAMMILLMFIGPEVVLLMGGQPYMEAIWIIPPVAGSMVFLFLVRYAVNIEFYYEKKWMLVGGTALAAIVNISLNYVCILQFGYIAAGYTTLISYIIFWLMNYWNARKICEKNGISAEEFMDFKTECLVGVGFLALMVGITLTYGNTMVRYCLFAVMCIVMILMRKKLIEFLKDIKGLKSRE